MDNNYTSCCFTGYRPQKFPFPIDSENAKYLEFENSLYDTVFSLLENGCRTFYCGMAIGFDIIAAECVLEAKRKAGYEDVSLVCVIPFLEQAKYFDDFWRDKYERILKSADETILISDRYYKGCYLKRNRFMVDNSDCVLTWFDGRAGGTASTIKYAESKGRGIINLCNEKYPQRKRRFYELATKD